MEAGPDSNAQSNLNPILADPQFLSDLQARFSSFTTIFPDYASDVLLEAFAEMRSHALSTMFP
jgi:hypothetical protein